MSINAILNSEIQSAYYDALSGNISVPVYDHVPTDYQGNYVRIQSINIVNSDEVSSKDSAGYEVSVLIKIVTNDKEDTALGGKKTAQDIAVEIEALLDQGRNINIPSAVNVVATLDSWEDDEDYLEPNKYTIVELTYVHLMNVRSTLPVPDAPSINIVTRASGTIVVQWGDDPADENTNYLLERAEGSPPGAYVQIANVSCLEYIDVGLDNALYYNYRVRAVNPSGISPYSNEAVANPFAGVIPSYNWPTPTGQTTSYRTGDDSYIDTNIFKPIRDAETGDIVRPVMSTFTTLVNDNSFNNKDRFTDVNGLQVYGDDYIIDHFTGLGWFRVVGSGTWQQAIDNALASNAAGFNDYFLPNLKQLLSIWQAGSGTDIGFSYAPFTTISTATLLYVSTSDANPTTNALRIRATQSMISAVAKSNVNNYIICRKHF